MTTDYEYTWDVRAVDELITLYPQVPANQNGQSGLREVRKADYDTDGFLVWEAEGHTLTGSSATQVETVTYRDYDAATAAPVEIVRDANLSGQPYSNPGGLNLRTLFTLDAYGRTIETTIAPGDEKERIERRYLTHLSGGETVVLVYPHFEEGALNVGPVSITVSNLDGRVITKCVGVTATSDGDPSNDLNEAFNTLEGAFAGTLSQRTLFAYLSGQLIQRREWTDAESPTSTHYVTTYGYDEAGRLSLTRDAEGTFTRHTYTLDGRVAQVEVGTDAGNPGNMVLVEERFYDHATAHDSPPTGDGNVTKVKRYVDSGTTRDTLYEYDWRNRRLSADGPEEHFELWTYDNMDRVAIAQTFNDDDDEEANEDEMLLSKVETRYDNRGRPFEGITYGTGEETGNNLHTFHWYAPTGDLAKTMHPGGAFTKNQYDGAGRQTRKYVSLDTDESTYSEALAVAGDTVVEQLSYAYDLASNVTVEKRFERESGSTVTGELSHGSGNSVRYEVQYGYDALHRVATVSDYGNDPPPGGDSPLVTTYSYTADGHLEDTVDPEGHRERSLYDNLGRVTARYSNRDLTDSGGSPGSDDRDRKVALTYDGLSRVRSRTVWMTGPTDPQTTEYVYGIATSVIHSNAFLKAIRHPDETTGSPSTSDEILLGYNRQGEVISRSRVGEDSTGNPVTRDTHVFEHDGLGRLLRDKVTPLDLDESVDDSVLRLEYVYDPGARTVSAQSYSAATGGTLLNELKLHYNTFGQVTKSEQEHEGGVDASTLSVDYLWSEAASDGMSRLQRVAYPGTGRKVHFVYAGDTDWALGRVSEVANDNAGSPKAGGVAEYRYQGLGRVKERDNADGTPVIQGDFGYEQYGQLATLAFVGSSTINDIDYGYNLNSQVTLRDEGALSSWDETYDYDGLDRLREIKRGQATGNPPSISGSPLRLWSLDLVGNWVLPDDDRDHNRSNEITSIISEATAPLYDLVGNTTAINIPPPEPRFFKYDAWIRLVEVRDDTTVLATYAYDALGRRIADTTAGRHYYYNTSWQLVSERDGPGAGNNTVAEYVPGVQYVDEVLQRDRDTNTPPNGSLDQTLYYVQDANWNVTSLVSGGVAVERYLYDAYGTPSFYDGSGGSRTQSAYANRALFTGRLWSAESYTYDYRRREYSPYLGRFLQRDPIGLWGDERNAGNGYAYVAHDPGSLVDPFGLWGNVVIECPDPVCKDANPASPTPSHQDIQKAWSTACDNAQRAFDAHSLRQPPIGVKPGSSAAERFGSGYFRLVLLAILDVCKRGIAFECKCDDDDPTCQAGASMYITPPGCEVITICVCNFCKDNSRHGSALETAILHELSHCGGTTDRDQSWWDYLTSGPHQDAEGIANDINEIGRKGRIEDRGPQGGHR